MPATAPGATPTLPGAGLPHDRLARLAAQGALHDLKACFERVLDDASAQAPPWLRQRVRTATDPAQLRPLGEPALSLIDRSDAEAEQSRQQLRHALDTLFPDKALPDLRPSSN